jgi:hypothetical protein
MHYQRSSDRDEGAASAARAALQAECSGQVQNAAADQAAAPRRRAEQPQASAAPAVRASRYLAPRYVILCSRLTVRRSAASGAGGRCRWRSGTAPAAGQGSGGSA